MEALLPRFRAADTQVLGVSIDSVHSHANWARDLGGVSFPLLADFEPKGAVAKSFGHYLAEAGITDRATVIIDKSGVVRYSESVTPGGKRDIAALAAKCEEIDEGQPKGSMAAAADLPDGTVLYVKSACGHSRRTLLALDNLHLRERIAVKNVTDDATALEALKKAGKDQAPCLVLDGKAYYESADVIRELVNRIAPV